MSDLTPHEIVKALLFYSGFLQGIECDSGSEVLSDAVEMIERLHQENLELKCKLEFQPHEQERPYSGPVIRPEDIELV